MTDIKRPVGRPRGRPKGVGDTYKPIFAKRAYKLARCGATDIEIGEDLGVGDRHIRHYKKKFPEFAAALKKGRQGIEVRLTNALLMKAFGSQHETSETQTTTTTVTTTVEGKQADGTTIYIPATQTTTVTRVIKGTKVVLPDTTAIIFTLKNRFRKRWYDAVAVSAGGEGMVDPQQQAREIREAVKAMRALDAEVYHAVGPSLAEELLLKSGEPVAIQEEPDVARTA